MKHFLITRFNIRSDVWTHTKDGKIITEKWLEKRFQIFETYCLPSVKNQQNQNFFWCICFDPETPIFYKNRIKTLAKAYDKIVPIYIDGFENFKNDLCTYIRATLTETDHYIITTRLDNDDLVHQDFIDTIQSLYVKKDKTLIDLVRGYQVILDKDQVDLRHYKSNYNPFISLIESVTNFETVIAHNHNDWHQLASRISYTDQPLWIQLIHEANLVNDTVKTLKKLSEIDSETFGIRNVTLKNSDKNIYVYNLLMTPNRVYDVLKKTAKRILLGR